jgi:TolB-like protein
MRVLSAAGEYFRVRLPDGATGFVHSRFIEPADRAIGSVPAGGTILSRPLANVGPSNVVAVLALVSYQQLAPSQVTRTAQRAAVATAASPTSPVQPGGISIAVLPFVNLSDDRQQEFFSDGMTEEITAALAKISALRVVARTSAFAFKGQNQDMRAVGLALGASHLIEGSVRKDGNEVRITAQLIKVDDGTHLWTESYNRELKGVFALQEEIASAIAGALRVPLGLQQGETLVSNRTNDVESYQQYLRARALYRARDINQAITLLEPAVARDPNYAPAWALLAQAYTLVPAFNMNILTGPIEEVRPKVQSALDKAERAAREAIRLDPRHAGGYGALAYTQTERGNWVAGEDLFRQALALDSGDPDALHFYSITLGALGRLKQALSLREQLRTLEPFVPIYNLNTAQIMQLNGQTEATIPLLEAIPSGGAVNYFRNFYLANAYAAAGRYGDAANALLAIPANTIAVSRRSVEDAARLLRSAPAKAGAPGALPALEHMGFVYAYAGAPDRLMDYPERLLEIGYLTYGPAWVIWEPLNASLRKTERFKAFVRKAGLLDYWRARGWPDLCRPVGADDFVCD